ncbi:hypothetical protein ONZ45_g17498 [Pleurotus djamor]|nr:hypothetical protein ONZ45_g17498 [Pleurotus djamor]
MGFDSNMYYHNSSRYSPSSRAADIDRLLDPAYSSSSPSSSSNAAYVDHHGNLHDPDFRHFPSYSPTKRRSVSVNSAHYPYSRPQWELGSAVDEDDDEEDVQERRYSNNYYNKRHSMYATSRYAPSYPTTTYTYISSPISSSPTSYSSEETALDDSPLDSSFLSDNEPQPLHRRCVSRLRGSRTRHQSQTRDEKKRLSEKVDEAPVRRSIESTRSDTRTLAAVEDQEEEEQEEYTPTCTQSLQRQWSCFALRWRLGVFRAKKRVRRRLSAVVSH